MTPEQSPGRDTGQEDPSDRPEEAEGVSILGLVNVLLRHRWVVAGLAVAAALAFAVYEVQKPTSYTATASFMPRTEGSATPSSNLSGLARQFGVSVGTGSANSPAFYAELATSREILRDAVTTAYRRPDQEGSDADSATSAPVELMDLYEVGGRHRTARVLSAVGRLRRNIETETSASTGIVELRVSTPWPDVSRQVTSRILELLQDFETKQSQQMARARREFIGERLEGARADLEAAEADLRRFLENNRRYENSPRLNFEHQRLQRRVDIKQQVVTSLASSHEQARIEEARNTPVLSVVERPFAPLGPDPERVGLKALLGLMLGGVLGTIWAFGREYFRRAERERPPEYVEFRGLLGDAVDEMRTFVSRIRGWLS